MPLLWPLSPGKVSDEAQSAPPDADRFAIEGGPEYVAPSEEGGDSSEAVIAPEESTESVDTTLSCLRPDQMTELYIPEGSDFSADHAEQTLLDIQDMQDMQDVQDMQDPRDLVTHYPTVEVSKDGRTLHTDSTD
jgi:hypothetical protein